MQPKPGPHGHPSLFGAPPEATAGQGAGLAVGR
jgi:hypothetical protein